jgi:hypothetical protein
MPTVKKLTLRSREWGNSHQSWGGKYGMEKEINRCAVAVR